MKRSFTLTLILAMIAVMTATAAFGNFEGVDLTKRNITVAANIDEENVSLSAVTVVPGKALGFTGFIANDTSRLGDDWDSITRVQVSREVVRGFRINLFGETTRRDSIGIERQIASGFFVSKTAQLGEVSANFGLGNFAEQERERTDLGLTETDANTVRGLAYTKLTYKNLSVLVKATPKLMGQDIRLLVNPTLDIGNGLSVSTEWFYDSDPAVENNFSDLGAVVQMNVDF